MRGVFQILLQKGDGLPAKDVIQQLQEVVPPTDFEDTTYPNRPNVRRYEKIVRFSTIGAVKAGWLVKNKGAWSLTDQGRAAFQQFRDPEAFIRETDRLYRIWKADQPTDIEDESEDDAGEAVATLEEAEEAAWSQIESFLENMSPYDFQELVAGLLRGMGYYVDWVSPPGPDKGIDIVAHTDPLGVKGPRIKVQVKRRAGESTMLTGSQRATRSKPETQLSLQLARFADEGLRVGEVMLMLTAPVPRVLVQNYLDKVGKQAGAAGVARARAILSSMNTSPPDYQRTLVHSDRRRGTLLSLSSVPFGEPTPPPELPSEMWAALWSNFEPTNELE